MPETLKLMYFADHSDVGGYQEVFRLWLEHMDFSRFSVRVVILYGHGMYEEKYRELGAEVISLSGSKYNPFIPARMAAEIRCFKPDILHCNLVVSTCLGPLLGRRLGVPAIMASLHSARPLRGFYRLLKPLYAHGCGICDTMIPVSLTGRDYLVEELGVELEKTEILPNTFNPSIADAPEDSRKKLCDRFGISEDAFIVVATGTLIWYKGHADLIRAISKLMRNNKKIYLLIVGKGKLETELRRLIAKLGLEEQVRLLGYLKHRSESFPDYASVLKAADAFVLSSYFEGFPLSALEAMWAEKPVVATKVSGIIDHFCDGEDIVMSEVGNADRLAEALDRMLSMGTEARATMAAKARRLVGENFSPQKVCLRLENIYERILMRNLKDSEET
ncbi:MAG: glycosyltransferase [Planctomycetes bacterium]|nr:glycosyltransferase [Planctomycetota bacterium]